MRVASDELVDQCRRDVVDVEGTPISVPDFFVAFRTGFRTVFLTDAGVEEDLQQHVAQFLDHVIPLACLKRLETLVGLFDQIWGERLMRLRRVPWAPPRRAETIHHRYGVEQACAGHVPGADEHLQLRRVQHCGQAVGQGLR